MFATSLEEAEEIVSKRNIGEVVLGVTDNIRSEIPARPEKNLHFITFLSYLALKSNTVDIDFILGDKGVLHELIHQQEGLPINIEEVKTKIDYLLDNVPGII